MEKDAEIERLKEHIIFLVGESILKNKLIVELADALQRIPVVLHPPDRELVQRAREATR